MASLDNVSTDDLRQVLAEVERKKPTQRVMAAINYLEEDELNPAEECWKRLNQELGNRLFEPLDDLRDAALSALESLKPPDVCTYLCP